MDAEPGLADPTATRPLTPAGRRRCLGPLALAALLALGASACRSGTPEAMPPDAPEADAGPVASTEDLAMLAPESLPGHLVVLTASPAGVSNRASRFALDDGERSTLWATEEGENVTDWTLAPDRSRVAYRAILREPGEPAIADELLVTRGLEADAPAQIVASADTARARLAGFAWSPDGSSLAYGKQIGGLPGAAPDDGGIAPSWELRAVAAEALTGPSVNDRLLWRGELEALGPNPLSLLAWAPTSGRAALLEQASDSGVAIQIRLLDTQSGRSAGTIESDGKPIGWSETAASPDGRHLLLAEVGRETAHLHLIDLGREPQRDPDRGGEARRDLPLPEGMQAAALMWDGSGRRAAWTLAPIDASVASAEPAGPSVAVVDLELDEAPRLLSVEGGDAAALAFSPDGRFLLVGERADPFGLGWSRLVAHELTTGARATLSWTLPEDSWAVYWSD